MNCTLLGAGMIGKKLDLQNKCTPNLSPIKIHSLDVLSKDLVYKNKATYVPFFEVGGHVCCMK